MRKNIYFKHSKKIICVTLTSCFQNQTDLKDKKYINQQNKSSFLIFIWAL